MEKVLHHILRKLNIPLGYISAILFLILFSSTVKAQCPPTIASMLMPASVCQGDSIQLVCTSPTPSTVQWYHDGTPITGATGNVYYAKSNGSYSIMLSGCATPSNAIVVTMKPLPLITLSPAAGDTLCVGQEIIFTVTTGPNMNWVWLQPGNLMGSTTNPVTQTLTNTTIFQVVGVDTLTNCSNVATVIIPVVTTLLPGIIADNQTICTGDIPDLLTAQMANGGTGTYAYQWEVSTTNSSSGFSEIPGETGLTYQPGVTTQNTWYRIRVSSPPCPDDYTNTIEIHVHQAPIVNSAPTKNICSGNSVAYTPTANIAGTTYTWTSQILSGVVSGVNTSGSGTINDVLSLPAGSSVTGTVRYIITPTGPGPSFCVGNPFNLLVTVYPTPLVTNSILSQDICAGSTTNSVILQSNVAVATFTWSAIATPGISGFITSGSGNIPAMQILSNLLVAGSVTYTIIPHGPPPTNCNGPATQYVINVNPSPSVTNNPMQQTICSGGTTSAVTLTSNMPIPDFTWTATAVPAGVAGYQASGTNTIPAQTITNSSNNQGIVTYNIVPGGSINGCPGIPRNYLIYVNPKPVATATPGSEIICSGQSTNIALSSNVANTTFSWTASGPASLSGYSNSNGASIVQNITNSGIIPADVTYIITPVANGCTGSPITVIVTVSPTPALTTTPLTQTICSGNTLIINLTGIPANAGFSWTASGVGVTGYSNGSGATIAQTLTNNTNIQRNVVYSITTSANGCTATSVNYTVIVNPTPVVNNNPMSTSICSGATFNLALSSNVAGTTYIWNANGTPGISGLSGGSGNTISQQLLNNTNSSGSVTYTITPSASSCNGPQANYIVTVHPIPDVSLSLASQSICSGTSSTAVLFSSTVPGTTYTWNATPSGAGISGYTASGSAMIPSQIISSTLSTQGTVTYAVTPVFNGCTGSIASHVITVNPLPLVTNPTMSQAICTGGTSANVNLLSNVTGTSFTWTATPSSAAITGFQNSGANSIPPQTITNSSLVPGTVTYQIIPTSNFGPDCQGTAANYILIVNPLPSVTSNLTSAVCSGQPFNYSITSNLAGSTYTWSRAAVAGISNPPGGGSASNINEVLNNLTGSDIVVTYVLTPFGPSPTLCPGPSEDLTVTVRALPQITAGLDIPIPHGTSTLITGLASGGTGALSYSWTPAAFLATGASTLTPHTINLTTNRVFTLNVTDAAGCASNDAMTVFITGTPLAALPSALPSSICLNQSSTLQANASGGSGTYTYLWSSNPVGFTSTSSSATVFPLVNTVYTVIVDDGFNTVSSSVAVTVNQLPVQYQLTGGGSYCTGGPGVNVGLAGSQNGVTYQLYNNGNPVNTPVLGNGGSLSFGNQTLAGIYTVVATRVTTGCTNSMGSSVSVSINSLPIVEAGVNQTIPFGTSTTLNGSVSGGFGSMNYSWTPIAFIGVGANTAAPLTTNLYSNTTFTLQITDANGCSGTDQMLVSLSGSAINVVASATPNQICADTSQAQLQAAVSGGAGSYSFIWTCIPAGSPAWASMQQNPMVSPDVTTTYTVVTNDGYNTATASATVVVNPLPLQFGITGGGAYCYGYQGVEIGLSGSQTNVDYQLYRSGTADGPPVTGTGNPISFGFHTEAFIYTVIATNNITGCINLMSGTATIDILDPPLAFWVTGGGSYPFGGPGRNVGLVHGDPGVSYQLYCNNVPVGTPIMGSETAIDFGLQTQAGTYTVIATDISTGCTADMLGSVDIFILPVPAEFTVTGGGTMCSGGPGLFVGLTGSETGVDYQLILNGFPTGPTIPGTNLELSWGPLSTAGFYEVQGINSTNGVSQMMEDHAEIIVNPSPTIFSLNPTGSQCPGTILRLNGSEAGIIYNLMFEGVVVDTRIGTGLVGFLDFGPQTMNGTYTIKAVNPITGCEVMMNGSMYINVSPQIFGIIPAGILCPGQIISLTGSETGVNYQLRRNGTFDFGPPVPGTGSPLVLGTVGLPGVYTAIAIDATTNCVSYMSDSATLYPDPAAFSIVPNGVGCEGDIISLNGSQTGVNYVLLLDNAIHIDTIAGTGTSISFGPQFTEGNYTILAINQSSYCLYTMNGTAVLNDSPIKYNLLPSGIQCAGTTIGLSGSQAGVSYQLMMNSIFNIGPIVPGTGGVISFGSQSLSGIYTVRAVNSISGCNTMMTDSVTLEPKPTIYSVLPAGSYCAGLPIHINGSQININYILILNGSIHIDTLQGTGNMIDFGPQYIPGVYTIVAYNAISFCTESMSGTTVIEAAPAIYNITPAGITCSGTSIGLDNSETGVSYQLRFNGTVNAGPAIAGTGSSITFGPQILAGIYTIIASGSNGCDALMSGNVIIDPLPAVFTVTPSGPSCANTSIGLNGSESGINYILVLDGIIHTDTIPGTGSAISFGAQVTAGSYSVIAYHPVTNCQAAMNGISILDANPVAYSMIPAGILCEGAVIGLSNSETGVAYQLRLNGLINIGVPVNGNGSAISFGSQSIPGIYSVVASNNNNCSSLMNDSVVINPLPITYDIFPSGNQCMSTSIGVNGSETGVNYILILNGAITIDTIPGNGASITFGPQSSTGTYTVLAYNAVTFCVMAMNNSTIITSAPTAFAMIPAGIQCSGTALGIDGSESGVSYQLRRDGFINVGAPLAGTGSPLDFGIQAVAGTYTVEATGSNGCSTMMNGNVLLNASPLVYTQLPAGSYCPGQIITMNGSDNGINYILYRDGSIPVDTLAGNGNALSFGAQNTGGNYTIIAISGISNCQISMNGNTTIYVSPTIFNTTPAGSLCIGTAIGLDDSELGVSYQLRRDGITNVGAPVAGTGSAISFGIMNIAGSYSIIATSTMNGCVSVMNGNSVLQPTPVVFTVVPQGIQCSGTSVALNGSQIGTDYVLILDNFFNLDTISGNGSVLDFGPQFITGIYTIEAIGGTASCQSAMQGAIQMMALPANFNVTPAGLICLNAPIGLDGSETDVDYTLFKNGVTTGITLPGTGFALAFGVQTSGDYTIQAVNQLSNCSVFMPATIHIGSDPVANAGADASICENQTATLNGTATNNGSILWSGMGDGTFDNSGSLTVLYTPGAGDIVAGFVNLILTVHGTGGCGLSVTSDTITITLDRLATANAGGSYNVCSIADFTINGASATNYSIINWISGGSGSLTNSNTLTPTYIPSAADLSAGSVTLTLYATGISPCTNVANDIMTMTFLPMVSANAGPDDLICAGSSFTFSGAFASNNLGVNWTSTGTGSFTGGNTLDATYFPSAADTASGSTMLILTASSIAPCAVTSSDTMVLNYIHAPASNAGADVPACENASVNITDATAFNSNSLFWNTSGTGNFLNSTIINPIYIPSPADIASGFVTLTLTVNGDVLCPPDADDKIISFIKNPVVFAGSDAHMCTSPFVLSGATSSNCNSVLWTIQSGSGLISNAGTLNPTYTPSAADIANGSATLLLTGSPLNPCTTSASDLVTLYINQMPVVNAGPDGSTCDNSNYTVSDATASMFSSLIWTSTGTGTILNGTTLNPSYLPSVTDITMGSVVLTLTASNAGCGMVSDNKLISFINQTTAFAGPDVSVCTGTSLTIGGASASAYSSIFWSTSGTGTITNGNTISPSYAPSPADIANGLVILTLNAVSVAPCVNVITDHTTLTIVPIPVVAAGNDAVICSTDSYNNNNATATNYGILTWSTSGTGTFDNPGSLVNTYSPSAADIAGGSIILTLTATNNAPCADVSDEKVISFQQGPLADAGPGATICNMCTFAITGASVQNSVSMHWATSGSGIFSNASVINPTYSPSATDIANGSVILSLTAYSTPPCTQISDTLTLTFSSSPGVDFTWGSACENQPVSFTVDTAATNTAAVSQWIWNFGDGSSSNLMNPSHLFAALGEYTVSISTIDTTGNVSMMLHHVTVTELPVAFFSHDTPGCSNDLIHFNDLAWTLYGNIAKWIWEYGDGSANDTILFPDEPNVLHQYAAPGIYYVTLTVTNSFGCIDQVTLPVDVIEAPVANFTFDNDCFGLETSFVDASYANGPGNTVQYSWFFGDPASGTNNYSELKDATHLFSAPGIYQVKHVVRNFNDCTDTITKTVTILTPAEVDFIYGYTCVNGLSEFAPDTSVVNVADITAWEWNFGDGIIDFQPYTTHVYLEPGTYQVTLTVTDSAGCKAYRTRTIVVNPLPVAMFNVSQLPCEDSTVTFDNVSMTYAGFITQAEWDFGDGNTQQINYPLNSDTEHIYSEPGIYIVKLTILASDSCTSEYTQTISVNPAPLANFEYDNACQGRTTLFTDLTSTGGTGAINGWGWNFGDEASGNANTSTIQNPSHTYANSGIYQVTLTTTAANGCMSIKAKAITITTAPFVDFSFDNRCVDTDIQFTPSAAVNAADVQTWEWSFGDGFFSAQPNPIHTYSTSGNYTVNLTITNLAGCENSVSKTIAILPAPVANFITSTPACSGQDVTFTNQSIAPAGYIVSWEYNFGDGSSQTINYPSNPSITHSYAGYGDFTVTLTVVTNDNCSASTARTITILQSPLANFDFDGNCAGSAVQFTDLSQGNLVLWTWNFGDSGSGSSNTSTLQNPVHTYQQPGIYTVTLLVQNNSGCYDAGTRTVTVSPKPTVNFSFNNGCASDTVNFNSSSYVVVANTVSWLWEFGDNTTSTDADPTHIYALPGTYIVSLSITNQNGCTNIKTHQVQITVPPIAIFSSNSPSCSGTAVLFDDMSSTSNGIISTWSWDFGDGTNSIINAPANPNVVHTYSTAGIYDVVLNIYTSTGCEASYTASVTINDNPASAFSSLGNCSGQATFFTDLSQSSIVSWNWDFGDPVSGINNVSTLQNPQHQYSEPGNYVVTLTTQNTDGCSNTVNQTIVIEPKPAVDFIVTPSCLGTAVSFGVNPAVTNVPDIASYLWDFGDGSPTSSAASPDHLFTLTGSYVVTLTITNLSGCENTVSHTQTVHSLPVAQFTHSGNCASSIVHFTDNSYNPGEEDIVMWQWDFGDSTNPADTSLLQNPTYMYSATGIYNVTLTVTTETGCTSVKVIPVTVLPAPDAQYSFVAEPCHDGSVIFQDESSSPQSLITGWYWEFSPGVYSTLQNPVHVFGNSDTCYFVKLVVTTADGCTDTTTQEVCIPSELDITFDYTPTCFGENTWFTPTLIQPTGGSIAFYTWNFGDPATGINNTSNLGNPQHIFSRPGTFVVSLQATDINNCSTTKYITILVSPLPIANFGYEGGKCDSLVTFKDLTTNALINSWIWQFGDGKSDTINSPSSPDVHHYYPYPGQFEVTLITQSVAGCSDTIVKTIRRTPCITSAFAVADTVVCQKRSMRFTESSVCQAPIASWQWFFGDNTSATFTTYQPFVEHTYAVAGVYTVKMVVATQMVGGMVTDTSSMQVAVKPAARAAFEWQDVCIGNTAVFENKSQNNSTVIKNYIWNFGDPSSTTDTSYAKDTDYNYMVFGQYDVKLVVINTLGCSDTIVNKVSIFENPIADFDWNSSCEAKPVLFTDHSDSASADLVKWNWLFSEAGEVLGASTEANCSYIFGQAGIYEADLTITDRNGCKNSITKQVAINSSPVAAFSIVENFENKQGQIMLTNGTINGTHYEWDFGNGTTSSATSPVVTFDKEGSYDILLTTWNGQNCADTLTLSYSLMFKGLYVPNAFNPGHFNPEVAVFKPKGTNLKFYRVEIYDRWDNLLWSSEKLDIKGSPAEAWDGTLHGNVLKQDVYLWKISAQFRDGEHWDGHNIGNNDNMPQTKAGTVTLIR